MSIELAYLAGFFDGEGSLGHWKGGQGGRYFCMSLVNSNREIIDTFHRKFGGCVYEKKVSFPSNKLQKKEMWGWRVWGEGAWETYYQLRPYLREKIWKGEPQN